MQYELYHYGILGQKWGVRRFQNKDGSQTSAGKKRYSKETEYRRKMANIANPKASATRQLSYDYKLANYRKDNLAVRSSKIAAKKIAGVLIRDALSGDLSTYRGMSKQQIAKKLATKAALITADTAGTVAVKDAMAKSMSKRYDRQGKNVVKTKEGILGTKEQTLQAAISAASTFVVGAAMIEGMRYSAIKRDRAINEARVNSWGKNILPQKVDNIVWQSDDLSQYITKD